MKKHILLIDDNAAIRAALGKAIKESDPEIELYPGQSLDDADFYAYDAGIVFDLMIVDFAYGANDYRFSEEADRRLERDSRGLAGWVWIKRYLREHPEYNRERIIGLSAYTDLLDPREMEQVGIRVIDKHSRDGVKLILEIVRRISQVQ